MSTASQTTRALIGHYDALKPILPGAGRPWLEALREGAIAGFAELGLPGPKDEDWRHTSLNAFAGTDWRQARESDAVAAVDSVPSLLAEAGPTHRLVFVNGRLSPALSRTETLPDGVRLGGLAEALAADDGELARSLGQVAITCTAPFVALNTALMQDGMVLHLPEAAVVEAPIEIVHLTLPDSEPVLRNPRHLIVAGAASRATIVEHHLALGDGIYGVNGTTEVRVGRDAALRLYTLQDQGRQAFHLHQTAVHIDAGGAFDSFQLALGARQARNEVRVNLAGPDAACRIDGAYALGQGQHCDNLTAVDHAEIRTASGQVFKGVLDDDAHAVFQGKVTVHPGAQGADGQQLNKTLLLSDKVEIDTKPELEIYADDVKCSHGATAGELSDEAIFYLRSRGIPEAEARDMLVEAFLAEAIAEIAETRVRDAFQAALTARLGSGSEGTR
ncbi:MAG: Fe-S cluster assembly protein SufD [Alphaproteobacteria bacterium]|nr:Fe-S cluster assembly protein SufD [Alphaproteobacteria bacterium]